MEYIWLLFYLPKHLYFCLSRSGIYTVCQTTQSAWWPDLCLLKSEQYSLVTSLPLACPILTSVSSAPPAHHQPPPSHQDPLFTSQSPFTIVSSDPLHITTPFTTVVSVYEAVNSGDPEDRHWLQSINGLWNRDNLGERVWTCSPTDDLRTLRILTVSLWSCDLSTSLAIWVGIHPPRFTSSEVENRGVKR